MTTVRRRQHNVSLSVNLLLSLPWAPFIVSKCSCFIFSQLSANTWCHYRQGHSNFLQCCIKMAFSQKWNLKKMVGDMWCLLFCVNLLCWDSRNEVADRTNAALKLNSNWIKNWREEGKKSSWNCLVWITRSTITNE